MAEDKKDFSDITFREGMTQLESIVQVLESGTLELEESLEKYACGVALLAELQRRLSAAEQKVEVLMGQLEAPPDDEVRDTTLNKA